MNRLATLLTGTLALGAVCYWCIAKHATAIETDVATRAEYRLQAAQLGAASVEIDGRDVVLMGTVNTDAERLRATDLVEGVWGVRRVDNQLVVAAVRGPAAEPVPVHPYRLTISRDAEGIVLDGLVPDDAVKAELLAMASVVASTKHNGNRPRVIDELWIQPDAPRGWAPAAKAVLGELGELERAEATLDQTHLTLTGEVASVPTRERIAESIQGRLPAGFTSDVSLSVTPVAAAVTCQARFDELLDRGGIVFQTASARLDPDNLPLLDKLALTAAECPQEVIRVEGHTDSSGGAQANLLLSEARAHAVVDYLISRGIATERLIPKGLGETQPIADNGSATGRAANRRIELVIEEGE